MKVAVTFFLVSVEVYLFFIEMSCGSDQDAVWQVAEAAHAPLELIDIVEIACPEKEAKKGMYGKVLIKCMELVKGLEVTVVAGKDFPIMDQVYLPTLLL